MVGHPDTAGRWWLPPIFVFDWCPIRACGGGAGASWSCMQQSLLAGVARHVYTVVVAVIRFDICISKFPTYLSVGCASVAYPIGVYVGALLAVSLEKCPGGSLALPLPFYMRRAHVALHQRPPCLFVVVSFIYPRTENWQPAELDETRSAKAFLTNQLTA